MWIDLLKMILSGAISFMAGEILKVIVYCPECDNQQIEKIGNIQYNTISCKNCSHEVIQFTNACNTTIGKEGEIGHAAAKFIKGYSIAIDPQDKSIFKKKYDDWLFFNMAVRSLGLEDIDFVIKGEISDYDSGKIYTTKEEIYHPVYYDAIWYENARIPLRWNVIPKHERDDRIFAIDLKVLSRYGDLLCEDRILKKLF